MLLSFLVSLVVWIAAGTILALVRLFVYFRGPQHMIQVYESYEPTKQMAEDYKMMTNEQIVKGAIVAGIIFPPMMFLLLCVDVHTFTFGGKG